MDWARAVGAWWMWLALGLAGLALAVAGAAVYAGATDDYIAAHPAWYSDFFNVPAPSDAESRQAVMGGILVLVGCVVALGASLTRLATTKRRWLALRGVIAWLSSVLLGATGLRGWFQLYVNTLCGDCTPAAPNPPWPAFSAGADVLGGAILLGFVLGVFLLLWSVLRRSAVPVQATGIP